MTDNPVVNLARKADLPSPTRPEIVWIASLSERSRPVAVQRLKRVCALAGLSPPQDLDWSTLRAEHVMAMRAALQDSKLAPMTINSCLSSVKAVARSAFRLGLIPAEAWTQIKEVPSVKGDRLGKGRALDRAELEKLLAICDTRDRALILTMAGTGLRRAELAALTLANIGQGMATLRVIGKGNREREIPIHAVVAAALQDWLKVRGTDPGPLFTNVPPAGREWHPHSLSTEAIYGMLKRRAQDAGLARIAPHDLRRTFITLLLEAGANIAAIQKLAGHANVQTTLRYSLASRHECEKAIGLLQLNGQGKANF